MNKMGISKNPPPLMTSSSRNQKKSSPHENCRNFSAKIRLDWLSTWDASLHGLAPIFARIDLIFKSYSPKYL